MPLNNHQITVINARLVKHLHEITQVIWRHTWKRDETAPEPSFDVVLKQQIKALRETVQNSFAASNRGENHSNAFLAFRKALMTDLVITINDINSFLEKSFVPKSDTLRAVKQAVLCQHEKLSCYYQCRFMLKKLDALKTLMQQRKFFYVLSKLESLEGDLTKIAEALDKAMLKEKFMRARCFFEVCNDKFTHIIANLSTEMNEFAIVSALTHLFPNTIDLMPSQEVIKTENCFDMFCRALLSLCASSAENKAKNSESEDSASSRGNAPEREGRSPIDASDMWSPCGFFSGSLNAPLLSQDVPIPLPPTNASLL